MTTLKQRLRIKLGLIFGALLLVVLVGFQNCSQVNFRTANSPIASAAGAPVVTNTPPDATPTPAPIDDVIRSLQPAMAVRGIGCVSCHAQVSSTLISDWGLGDAYYFGKNSTTGHFDNGTPYGDHQQNLPDVTMGASQKIVVPKNAQLPSAVTSNVSGVSTIADYVKKKFSQSSHATTVAATVQESSSIYIGAPTDADLTSAFSLKTSDRMKFVKSKTTSPDLSGVVDNSTYFSAIGNVTCEGDLVVRGPLYVKNLNLISPTGCRIYVIGSVFIYGAVSYASPDATRNLQISSSRAIAFGLGTTKKSGDFCDKSSSNRWYTQTSDSSYSRASSLLTFFKDQWTVPNTQLRNGIDPLVYGQSIIDEASAVEAGEGTLYDGSCLTEGRSISYERILLNAPLVYSRYSGNVDGTIIAEVALMSIGSFKFTYDPVFNSVNVLPYVSRTSILNVQ